jgi:NADH-quinone oxidoreductase subunit C
MTDVDTTAEDAPEEVRDEQRETLIAALTTELGDALVGSHYRAGDEVWIRVKRDAWVESFRVLHHRHRMHFFDFLSAIDWLPSPYGRDMDAEVDTIVHGKAAKDPDPMVTGVAGGDTRFQLFARVIDVGTTTAVIVKCDLPDDDLVAPTLIPVYAGANWHEREVWEMYGIDFAGHPDLRKLYLPTDFEGYPLRKDFPLLARRVKPWPGIVDVEQMPGDDEPEPEAEAGDS